MKKLIIWVISAVESIINGFTLKRRHVEHDSTLKINGLIRVFGHGRIAIGTNVKINSKESTNPGLGACSHTVFSVPSGELIIGNRVGMSNVAITCVEKVVIEDDVLLGGGVKIYDTDFHSLNHEKRGKGRDIDIPITRPVVIKKNAFIGAHAIILKGVTIGERSVVGAGAVVTKDIPDDEIWGGNPAKHIR